MSVNSSVFILADVSGSMFSPVPKADNRQRIDLLRDTLAEVLEHFPSAHVIAFATTPQELEPGQALPDPNGSTALDLALGCLYARLPISRIMVLSDGICDDPQAAITAARALGPVTIDAFHIGDETDKTALAFLKRLSLAGGTGRGRYGPRDLSKPLQLAAEIRLLLTGPGR